LNKLEIGKKESDDKCLKLNDEIEHYNKLCEEQENTIKNLSIEKKNLMEQLGTINYDNKNLTQKLKSTNENLNIANKQLNDANKTILRLDEDLNQTEKSLSKAKNDISTINNMLNNEKRIKEELQDKGNRLEMTLKEKMEEIKEMGNDIMNLNANLDTVHLDNERMNKEIEKYKAHIMFLTETNQKLINELEAVSERDNQLKMILSQTDEIPDFLNKTRNDIDNALNNLEIGLTSQK
jgi:chromosome segregation protein